VRRALGCPEGPEATAGAIGKVDHVVEGARALDTDPRALQALGAALGIAVQKAAVLVVAVIIMLLSVIGSGTLG
jgi:hypothetical protein